MDCEHLPSLQELCLPMCLAKITSSLTVTNFWSVRRQLMFPWYANLRSIKLVMDAFICDHFIEISQTDQILTLDEQEMNWLFDNQDIKASEATMLHCLVRWYQHQQADREKVFKDLFPKIHLYMIPKKYLWSVIKKYKLLKVMPELIEYKHSKVVELSDEALYKQNLGNIAVITTDWMHFIRCYLPFTLLDKPSECFHFVFLPPGRLYEFGCFFFTGMVDKKETFMLGQKLFVFSLAEESCIGNLKGYSIKLDDNVFSACQPFPQGIKYWTSSMNCGMYIFFLGCSRDTDEASNRVYRYDTVNDVWKKMAPMIYSYSSQPLIVCYNERYIFIFDNQRSEKYDIYTNKWSAIRPMPAGMICSNGRQVGNKIFIFYYGHKPRTVNKCFTYDPLSDTWEELKNLNELSCLILRKSLLDLQSFFGKVLVLSYNRLDIHTVSEINLQERKMKYLCSSKFEKGYLNIPHMFMLTRGTRVFTFSQGIQPTSFSFSTESTVSDSPLM